MAKLEVGSKAPDFSLKDHKGREHKLSDYKGKKVIVYFYPKDLTPSCTIQACDFSSLKKDFENKNAAILGISNDDENMHQQFIAKHDINYTLLCDIDKKVSKLYGVYGEKQFMGNKSMGIFRTTFIIDESSKIVRIHEKVKAEGHAKMLLEELDH